MRSLVSLLLVTLIGLGTYVYFLKRSAPEGTSVATQAIATTGVEMDLMAIAQAERTYFAENGSYTDLDQLQSNGALNMTSKGRDGYSYSVDTWTGGFAVTARHADPGAAPDAVALHYPTLSIDQSMQIHQSN